jgi:hypothetical protein
VAAHRGGEAIATAARVGHAAQPGNRNDCTVYRDSAIADTLAGRPVMADGGYRGNPGVIMPYRKRTKGTALPDWQEDLTTIHRKAVPESNMRWPG